jgi:MOSC domain-containing protein YiiM
MEDGRGRDVLHRQFERDCMWQGTVESIHIATRAAKPTQSVTEIRALPGKGLEGDRYATQQGTFSKPKPEHELTLIEAEAIEAASRDYQVQLAPGEARRNVVTRGVPLTHLVGKEFSIGDVRVRGIRLCEPCDHLQKLTGRSVIKSLLHRGGLRAQILSEGKIGVGSVVSPQSTKGQPHSAVLASIARHTS